EKEEVEEEDDMEDVEVDVVNLDADEAGCSSDEDDARLPTMPTTSSGPLWFVPETPVIENPEYPILSALMSYIQPAGDVNFLDQPAGGKRMQYDNPKDLRRHMIERGKLPARASKPEVRKVLRRTAKS
ncbi:hypothetical protein PMAYCL1PPCAC_09063, partial [Pristionchus mayeri]